MRAKAINDTVVLIPSYCGGDDLCRSIQSIHSRDRVDVLVIDDGSPEPPSLDSLRSFFHASGTLHLEVLPTNVGCTEALNRGLQWIYRRNYQFIGRLDAGDCCIGQRFEKQRSFLRENPTIGIVGGWAECVDPTGRYLFSLRHPIEDAAIRRAIYCRNPFVHPSVMLRASCLQEIGGYPVDYPVMQDWACFLRLLKVCDAANLPESLVEYEINPASISSRREREQNQYRLRLLYEHFRLTPNQCYGILRCMITGGLPRSRRAKIRHFMNRLSLRKGGRSATGASRSIASLTKASEGARDHRAA